MSPGGCEYTLSSILWCLSEHPEFGQNCCSRSKEAPLQLGEEGEGAWVDLTGLAELPQS